jgi:hypothetical protein
MIEINVQKLWLSSVLACCSGVSLDIDDQDEQRDQLVAQLMGWA